ncbi:MAG: helix-turn-helix domain-containing protein [Nitrolancea sp.]
MDDRQPAAPAAMTIHQLSEYSGVPVRRIRHFVAEGLLAPPHGRGRAAHYDRTHLDRVRQIQALRDTNVGLDQIRKRLGEPRPGVDSSGREVESWQRWEIIPGVELHLRANLDTDSMTLARILLNTGRQLFSSDQQER